MFFGTANIDLTHDGALAPSTLLKKMKHFLLYILLLLSYSLAAQSQNEGKIDSLKQLVSTERNDSLRMEAYNQLRKLNIRNDLPNALEYCE